MSIWLAIVLCVLTGSLSFIGGFLVGGLGMLHSAEKAGVSLEWHKDDDSGA